MTSIDTNSIETALDMFGDAASQLIELTLKDADRFIGVINDNSQDSGDATEVSEAAHALKSIMRQIGANEIAELAYQLETAGKSGDLNQCITLHPTVTETYNTTKSFLKNYS